MFLIGVIRVNADFAAFIAGTVGHTPTGYRFIIHQAKGKPIAEKFRLRIPVGAYGIQHHIHIAEMCLFQKGFVDLLQCKTVG